MRVIARASLDANSVMALECRPDQGMTSRKTQPCCRLWAATAPEPVGKPGVYCEDCNFAAPTVAGSPMARWSGVDIHACDEDAAERLWSESEAMRAAA